ncbi:hypothetical protein BV25DRAFT_1312659 [Artomyces pyxidatus]|uniref:Uncharacterized protein n=1 Tax=Artomyces pyxidatus TaxID=48021 RepID=A0ACB8SQM8_9AGAM|nr:hypothetical protein BV25DRAFT_1312659 [Artomyces pyxidatus]
MGTAQRCSDWYARRPASRCLHCGCGSGSHSANDFPRCALILSAGRRFRGADSRLRYLVCAGAGLHSTAPTCPSECTARTWCVFIPVAAHGARTRYASV